MRHPSSAAPGCVTLSKSGPTLGLFSQLDALPGTSSLVPLCVPSLPNASLCNLGTKPLQGALGPPTHPHPPTQLLGRRQETFWQDQSPARGPDPCTGL